MTETLLNAACLRVAFCIVSFENHISPARQMLTGDTSRPPPLRYLRTCAKVDNTNVKAGVSLSLSPRSKDQGCSCSNAISSASSSAPSLPFLPLSLARRSPVVSSSSRDMKRDDEVTSALSSPRIRLEAESGLLSSITWTRRDIREVSAVSTGERARTSIINRGGWGGGHSRDIAPR